MRELVVLIPIRKNKKEFAEIATATNERLSKEFKIHLPNHEAIPTIAFRCIQRAIRALASIKDADETVTIDFFDLFTLSVSFDESDDSEKEGNFVPDIKLSERVINAIKNRTRLTNAKIVDDNSPSVFIDPVTDIEIIEKIRNEVQVILKEEHLIDTRTGSVATTIGVVYFEEMVNWIINNHVSGEDTEIKFAEILELGVRYEDDELIPFALIGQEGRVNVKNDDE